LQLWKIWTLKEISVWETSRENIKISANKSIGYYVLKKHKPYFHDECSRLLEQKKQSKLQWLKEPSEINEDNLNNLKRETSRHFRNKTDNILNTKLMSLQRTVRTRTSESCIEE
jgi:hypothetical protein